MNQKERDYSIPSTNTPLLQKGEAKHNTTRLDDILQGTITDLSSFINNNSLEHGQNPLEEPRDDLSPQRLRIKPQNGMVLRPRLLPKNGRDDKKPKKSPSLGIFKTKGRFDSDDVDMEVFQPQLFAPPSKQQQQRWQSHLDSLLHSHSYLQSQNQKKKTYPPRRVKTMMQYIDDREKEKNSLYGIIADIALEHKKNDQSMPPAPQTNHGTNGDKQNPKKLSPSNFLERDPKIISARSKALDALDSSDHLSDVPSDIDSLTRERYLLACQMLKITIIQKETSLIPLEKEYILNLLEDYETNGGSGSVISEERVTAIEHAILNLKSGKGPPSPATAARARRTQELGGGNPVETSQELRDDKNPHTATRKLEKKFTEDSSNPCKPFVLAKIREREKYPSDEEENEVLKNDTNVETIEIDPDDDENYLVRYDGWSFQNSEDYPFLILGNDGNDMNPRVFTPGMMEALRGFMPLKACDHNFWLRFSLVRDGGSLTTILSTVRVSQYTMIGVETDLGEVFGSFTGTPWRIGSKWYGTSEAFLWRLKKRRYTSPQNSRKPNFEREIEVYPCTEDDELVQYCTAKTMAVGGGSWQFNSCPYSNSDQGIGFMVDGDLAGGETSSCGTFASPKLARYTTSGSKFTIRNLEVWTLIACSNLEDATQMEWDL